MSDVNFLARRARLLGRQLSDSWMASAGGLLNELANALEAKAGAEAAGEAVAASEGVGQGVGGVGAEADRLNARWRGRVDAMPVKSVDAHKSLAEMNDELRRELEDFGVLKPVGATWFVPGRGPMTPQQMADALVEVDRKLAQTGERLFEDEEAHRSLRRVKAELAEARRDGEAHRMAARGWMEKAVEWERQLGYARALAADFRREADERKGECEEVRQRHRLEQETNARLRVALDEADAHAATLQAKIDEPAVHTLESFADALRRNGWIVFRAPKAIEEAVQTVLCTKMPGASWWHIEGLVKATTDALLKTSQS